MLVARFSDDIQADIARGFSCYQLPGLGGTRYDNEWDCKEFHYPESAIRELPDGGFGIWHHDGLSCYALEAETVEDAIHEVATNDYDGSGFAEKTVGVVTVLRTITKEEAGTIRDLHILECEHAESEQA